MNRSEREYLKDKARDLVESGVDEKNARTILAETIKTLSENKRGRW